jgi:hypothetical protein
MHLLRLLLAFVAGVLVTAITGSLWQTRHNLAAIEQLGHEVPAALAAETMLADLLGFGPLFAGLAGLALLVAFMVAALLVRALAGQARYSLYALAGAAAVLALLAVMGMSLPVTAIAAARTAGGTAGLALCGALGGLVFAALTPPAH